MAYMLPHLHNAWSVEEAVKSQEDKLIVIRWGADHNDKCIAIDPLLVAAAEVLKSKAVVYCADPMDCPESVAALGLVAPMSLMFFYRRQAISVDVGGGNCSDKLTVSFNSKQQLIDLIEAVHKGAVKGRMQVSAPKDYATSYRY